MLRRAAPLLLAPLLASCQPPEILVRAGFIGNALVFIPVDSDDNDSIWCWREAAVLDGGSRPAWRFEGSRTGDCNALFPLSYGRAPEGGETVAKPARLEPDRLYVLVGNATAEVYGAFSLRQEGTLWTVDNVDPYSAAAVSIRQAWWDRPMPGGPDPAQPEAGPATRP
ncbi:MAG: hypothetical protein ABWX67_16915 [Allosphingosinicella sp.]